MGVHGLWRLIEPSGKPVPLETLENKVLAVDISIWLHQAVKGFQDPKGGSVPNAHLLGIFHRICKLLYFKIKPIFVFDGGVPNLKKQTIAKRNQSKSKNVSEVNKLQKQLISALLKHSAVNNVLKESVKSQINKKQDDLFELPPSQMEIESSSSDEEQGNEEEEEESPSKEWDLHTIDEKSAHFKNLPADVRYEILTELKETRKQNSWGRIHELPTYSNDFSTYQMRRLLKRNSIQASLEEAEKEMGGVTLSLGELENILKDQGVINTKDIGSRIASDENKRFILIKDVKKAMHDDEKLKKIEEQEKTQIESEEDEHVEINGMPSNKGDLEYEEDLKKAIELSLQDVPSTSKSNVASNVTNATDEKEMFTLNFIDDNEESDTDSSLTDEENNLYASAKNYMTEYSGLTPAGIANIISGNNKSDKKNETKEIQDDKLRNGIENADEVNKESSKNDLERVQDKEHGKIESNTEEIIDKEKNTANMTLQRVNKDILELNTSNFEEVKDKENKIEQPKLNTSNLEEIKEISDNVELMSDSESEDEFVEIESKEEDKGFEIVIDKNCKIEDHEDIFSDVFADINDQVNDLSEKENLEHKEQSMPSTEVNSNKKEEENVLLDEILTSAKVDKETALTKEHLANIKSNLASESNELLAKRSLKERLATNISEQMCQEAQELLQLFGIPYIVAPMEAEAQCAFLDEISLTDGTITDDSDIWLFGGRTVYKNFFNQTKRVMEYKSESINHSFKLSRYEMILFALLVGSDYTTGVQGVGPVTALEILANFPLKKGEELTTPHEQLLFGLRQFKRWLNRDKVALPGRATLRNKLKNVKLGDQFPSVQVIQAYLEPTVETSSETFSWGKPDVVSLTDFAKEKFGWSYTKTEEILKPVLKRMEEVNVQSKITNFYKSKHKINDGKVEEKMSERVKMAVKKMGKDEDELEEKTGKSNNELGENNKTVKEKKLKSNKRKKEEVGDEDLEVLKVTKKVSRKRAKQIENEMKYALAQATKASTSSESSIKDLQKRKLHAKEVIPQKLKEKNDLLKNKLKAIEVFRKSKRGPGYVPKRKKAASNLKEDAELSEESD